MTSDPDVLARALAATLSIAAAQRTEAEALLARLAAQPDHAAHLLRLAAGHDPVVAAAAALRLKNLLILCRTHDTLPEEARSRIRDDILHALSVVRGTNVESVLAETTRWLVLLDFPAKWPNLLPTISDFLSSGDSSRIHAALIALRQLTKCYEFRGRDASKLCSTDPNDAGLAHPRQPLETIAAACFPTLHALYLHLDQIIAKEPYSNPKRRDACVAQRLIVKTFWSCTQFILPPALGEPGVLDQWMNGFLETIRRPPRHPYIDSAEDLTQEPEWKTKKWLGQIFTRFLKRYGSPKKVPIDEPWAKTVAEAFKDRYAERATTTMLEILSSQTQGHQLSRRVAHLALDYLEEAIETASLWFVIRPHVDTLLTRVVLPYLCFSEADEEVWNNDPGEYVRKQYDFTEDFTSPRMAAVNLLSKMADLRSKSTVLPFLQYLLQSVLEPYLNSAVGSQQRATLARQKAGAFASLAAVKSKLMSKKELSDSFIQVLETHVEPDLRSEFGFLRSEAAWLLGQVASCGWKEFSQKLGEIALRGCVGLLQDKELPVQAAAAGSLQFLMEKDGPNDLIRQAAPQLLERLLQLMDNMSDDYLSLLPALDKLIMQYREQIIPLALPLVQRLAAAFRQSAQGVLGGDDEDDDLAFTASQVLHLIASLICSFGEWKGSHEDRKRILESIEKEVQPVLEPMFDESHQVFVEEFLDVLGILIFQSGDINHALSPFVMSLVPKMMLGLESWAVEYLELMMDSMEGYLRYGLREILAMDGCLAAFMRFIDRLWTGKYGETYEIYGMRLADALILSVKTLTAPQDQIGKQVAVELARSAANKCVRTAEDRTDVHQRLFAIVLLCVHVDARVVLSELGVQSVMQLIASETSNMAVLDRIYSKKSMILGIGSILCTEGLVVEESKPHLLGIALKLQQSIDDQRASKAQSAEQSGSNFAALSNQGNGFSPFVAAPPTDDYGSDLEDDQDATNFLDDLSERQTDNLERLAAGSGLSISTLQELHSTNGNLFTGQGLFDVDNLDTEEDYDEGGLSPLDDMDEAMHLVQCVKQSSVEAWWGKVSERDRMAMEALAKRTEPT